VKTTVVYTLESTGENLFTQTAVDEQVIVPRIGESVLIMSEAASRRQMGNYHVADVRHELAVGSKLISVLVY